MYPSLPSCKLFVLLAVLSLTELSWLHHRTIVAAQPFSTPGLFASYSPRKKNWAMVVRDCLEAGRQEKRMYHHLIRAVFHDALSITRAPCQNCGGADASLLLNTNEWNRGENIEFAERTSFVIRSIANKHGVSAADALAVCAYVAAKGLTPNADLFTMARLKVGRRDNTQAAPSGVLPGPVNQNGGLVGFFAARGMTTEEGVALLGSHSLLKRQGCLRKDANSPDDLCTLSDDPAKDTCADARMYQFDNHFFQDACNFKMTIIQRTDQGPPTLSGVSQTIRTKMETEERCRFTQPANRTRIAKTFNDFARTNDVLDPQFTAGFVVNITSKSPFTTWPYTVLDAFMGAACQGELTDRDSQAVGAAMRKFSASNAEWLKAYAQAYAKMVNQGATFSRRAFHISGRECGKGWVSSDSTKVTTAACRSACPNRWRACPATCVCRS